MKYTHRSYKHPDLRKLRGIQRLLSSLTAYDWAVQRERRLAKSELYELRRVYRTEEPAR